MTGRMLAWVAGAVVGLVLILSSLVGALFTGAASGGGCGAPPGPGTAPTRSASTPSPDGPAAVGRWDAEQVGNAAVIVSVGAGMNVPARGWVVAVATAMQESSLRNLPGGDRDSVGLFQQRPSQGWGTPAQLADPAYAAGKFYSALAAVPGWQAMPLTQAAQAVQRSAHPDAYAKWETDAGALVTEVTGQGDLPTAPAAGCAAAGPQGWVRPVDGAVISGFRTLDRPGHNGVDLAADRGTPIRAATAGTVSAAACQAIAGDGSDYGCDRDGSAAVRGCGWYVDITHPRGILTRYCHQQLRPAVTVGQQVAAGQVIGLTGASGNATGPHLHFEVHIGDGSPATATDPVPFMAAHGAPLAGR